MSRVSKTWEQLKSMVLRDPSRPSAAWPKDEPVWLGVDPATEEIKGHSVVCQRDFHGIKIIASLPAEAKIAEYNGQFIVAIPSTGEVFRVTDEGLELISMTHPTICDTDAPEGAT